jgi:hypothetical protein
MNISGSDLGDSVLSLKPLYDFAGRNKDDEEALRLSKSKLGAEYCKLCEVATEPVDECQGFYLWGSYDGQGLWRNIYLGWRDSGKARRIFRKRICEELKDERAFLWRHVPPKQR